MEALYKAAEPRDFGRAEERLCILENQGAVWLLLGRNKRNHKRFFIHKELQKARQLRGKCEDTRNCRGWNLKINQTTGGTQQVRQNLWREMDSWRSGQDPSSGLRVRPDRFGWCLPQPNLSHLLWLQRLYMKEELREMKSQQASFFSSESSKISCRSRLRFME